MGYSVNKIKKVVLLTNYLNRSRASYRNECALDPLKTNLHILVNQAVKPRIMYHDKTRVTGLNNLQTLLSIIGERFYTCVRFSH